MIEKTCTSKQIVSVNNALERSPQSLEAHREDLARLQREVENAKEEMENRIGETEYYFAIVLKSTGKMIGEIDAYSEHAEPHDDGGGTLHYEITYQYAILKKEWH